MRRVSSVRIAEEIKENKATLTVIDPFVKRDFKDTDFNEVVPIGEGDQGAVYAVLVKLSDGTEERMVVKRLKRVRHLPMNGSTSTIGTHSSSQRAIHNHSPFETFRNISSGAISLTNNNLISLVHIMEHNGEKYALSAYAGVFLDEFIEGTLRYLYDNDRNKYLTVVKKIMLDTLRAVMMLNYDKGYVHRDIKPENIALLDDEWCLVDFEASARVGARVGQLIGSPYYIHPACFLDKNKSTHPGNDMFALSLVFERILFLPIRFKSLTYREMAEEKSELYKAVSEERYVTHTQPETSLRPNSRNVYDKLVNIAKRMGSVLMSEQPDIHDIIAEIVEMSINDDNSFLDNLYSSSKSDGFFNKSLEERQQYERQASFRRDRRRSSVVNCLQMKADFDTDEDTDDGISDSSSPIPNASQEFRPLTRANTPDTV